MSDITVDIDVLGKHIPGQVKDAIEDGIQEGGAAAANEAQEVAEQRIRTVGAVWTGDLLESFDIDIEKRGNKLVVTLTNWSDHAKPIEYGAEYTDRGPPVVALIPWVKSKMRGYQIPEDDLEDLPDPEEVNESTSIWTADGREIDLASRFDDSIVQQAFWLQQHIKEEGLDAVGFMKRAEEYIDREGHWDVANAITSELR